MTSEHGTALARLRDELRRPPFHQLLRPHALSVDPDSGTVTIGLDYRDELARGPNEKSFHGGVIATLIDMAGHAAVAIKIGKMAPTIDLRVDYLRPSAGENLVASARLLQLGATFARVDVDVADAQGRLIAVGRGSFSTGRG
ncbi:MAG TPA: hotdog fold thioesterase [Xanthobacteraceae bacterium]|jgi:uncharacterized protein (TIGR00369 family)